MEDTKGTLAIESWMLYAVGVCLILSRIICRLITLRSPRKLQLDDWMMAFILIPFTGTVVCANKALLPGQTTPTNHDIQWTRKMRFTLEELQISTNWLVKACLLVLYRRIFPASTSRTERRFVTYVSIYCLLSFCLIQILLPVWCRPLHHYWAAVPSNAQCTSYHNHSILALTLSALMTVATLIVPVPLIPTPRKLLLAALLLLGAFVLVAGILARYCIMTSPTSSVYLYWLMAETTLTILFANLPFLSSLITSTTPSRARQMGGNLSLSQWPRSYKDTPPLRADRQHLDSITKTISTLSPACSDRVGSTASTVPHLDVDDGWSDAGATSSIPPTPVRKMTLTDPPPELEVFWTLRRSSTRDGDSEKMGTQEMQWPLR
ncbi:hypothetical protein K458DRAFT_348156 [Lentithecium fluviatile CBS 122367]|uniref:Rhodopsin domain-containing protein n=1 Tax=Lentithecium fluviatile CBS 122367 TaxID=1168545 RepID=A0A6G1IJT3_9PLEO|nr:hypothetical protein K458DRAFT_348156 [Lentithecium fluviatile CBS 122367]